MSAQFNRLNRAGFRGLFLDRLVLGFLAGLALGAMAGAGIIRLAEEPFPQVRFFAATLSGGLTGLLIGAALRGSYGWPQTLFRGWALGLLVSAVVILSGGYTDAPLWLQSNSLQGILLATILKKWGRDPS